MNINKILKIYKKNSEKTNHKIIPDSFENFSSDSIRIKKN